MTDKKYNILDPILQNVMSQSISYSNDERKEYNSVLKQVLEKIVEEMKEVDDVFKCLYQKVIYTGSFYENLRISKPDEFDINLVFSLPLKLRIIYESKPPGFVKLKVEGSEDSKIKSPNLERVLKSWSDGYLSRSKFLQWMQGVFNKAINALSIKDIELKPSASGPALTIIVTQPLSFSVDLVPVIEFSNDKWPSPPVRKCPSGISCNGWYTVPKAPDGIDDSHFWRISFYNHEKELMNGLDGMKPVIKLLKLVREQHKWKFLSSYAIKTIFLWEDPPKKDFWRNGLGLLFMHMLGKLCDHAKLQKIPFYWDKNLNLLKGKKDTISNMANCLEKMMKKINQNLDENPRIVVKYFGLLESEIQDKTVSSSEVSSTSKTTNTAKSWVLDADSPVSCSVKNIHHDVGRDKCQIVSETVKEDSKPNVDDIPPQSRNGSSSDNLLSNILKEQKECRRYLESISQKLEKLLLEVEELKAENYFLRDLVRKTNTNSSINFSHNLIELDEVPVERDSRSSLENSLPLIFQ